MADSTTVAWLSTAIGQAARSAKFCFAGCLPLGDHGIEVDGLGTITLPLKRKTERELVASCQIAWSARGVPIPWCSRRPTAPSNGPSSVSKRTADS